MVHAARGPPNFEMAKWLIVGSVPMAFSGPSWSRGVDPDKVDDVLKICIGFALLFAAATYALRLYINLRAVRRGFSPTTKPRSGPSRRSWSAPSAACWSA